MYFYRNKIKVDVKEIEGVRILKSVSDRFLNSNLTRHWEKKFNLNKLGDVYIHKSLIRHSMSDANCLNDFCNISLRVNTLPLMSNRDVGILNDLGSLKPILPRDGGILIPTLDVFVQLRRNISFSQFERVLLDNGITTLQPVPYAENCFNFRVSNQEIAFKLAIRMVEANIAEFAHPQFVEEIPDREKPLGSLFAKQWHLENRGGNNTAKGADIGVREAWKITRGAPEIKICIIDRGIQENHESFNKPGKIVSGFDFLDNDNDPSPIDSSHGTSCAGLAAASWDRGKVTGVAPLCSLLNVRRSQLVEHKLLAEAFYWASENGADVISCSFGHDGRPWILPDSVRIAIEHIVKHGRNGRGTTIVWAAGNGSEDIASDEWASHPDVLSIGASTDRDYRAYYSDYGNELDLVTPSSGGIQSIVTTKNSGYTHSFGGTSAAAPIVAGAIALLLSVNPNLRCKRIRQLLISSARKIDKEQANYDINGHSIYYGYGCLDIGSAISNMSPLDELKDSGDVDEETLQQFKTYVDHTIKRERGGKELISLVKSKKYEIIHFMIKSDTFRADCIYIVQTLGSLSTNSRSISNSSKLLKALYRSLSTLLK